MREYKPYTALAIPKGYHVRLHMEWNGQRAVVEGHVAHWSSEWVDLGCGVRVRTGFIQRIENLTAQAEQQAEISRRYRDGDR